MAHYVHHIPGRLRVRSLKLKRNDSGALRVRKALEALEGIDAVETNSRTGSITVNYDRAILSVDSVFDALRQQGVSITAPLESGNDAENGVQLPSANELRGKVAQVAAGFLIEKVLERSALALVAAVL